MSDFKIVQLLNPIQINSTINPTGAYNNATSYGVGDSVSYGNSSYICILPTTGNLPTNTTYWQLLASASGTLDDLSDVSIVSVADNQVLKYDASNSLWKNETLNSADVGLGSVDNTSDANKPISSATQTALNGKQNSLGFTPEDVANKDNGTLSNSTTTYPTSGAVKTVTDLKANIASPTFTGTVTAPTLIIDSLTGVLKATSGTISSATAGTDYENPLTFSAPLSRLVNAVSIPDATTSVTGALTSTDWTTFNNKIGNTFESVSKNLRQYDYSLNYSSGVLNTIVYTIPSVGTITKTLNYTSGALTSVVLSGSTPASIQLTKTLTYTSGVLTSIAYT